MDIEAIVAIAKHSLGNLYRLCRISLTFHISRSDKEERRRSIAANAHDL